MANTHTYTRREEVVNAVTHGIGAVFSVAALAVLVIYAALRGSAWHLVSYTIYGVTMVLMYTSSTVLHALPEGKWKDLFEIFDHSSIYLFIAGTYTPILLTALRSPLGWALFGTVWGIAALGIGFKAFYTKRFVFMSTLGYIVMGWLIVLMWEALTLSLPPECIHWLIAGGIFYTLGSVFYVWRGFPYHHAVWHVFVLAGSAAHFVAILLMPF